MHKFVMYCKTYSGDLDRVTNLVESFNKFNFDNIFLYISAPKVELDLFEKLSNSNIIVISDESFAKCYLAKESHSGMSLGYINQQICKLTFYKSGVTHNYLCLDSDTVFIRQFYISDFMFDDSTPFTVLVMDKDLSIERHYREKFWIGRQVAIHKIYDLMGVNDRRLRTCHNSQVFSSKILESLKRDFMNPKGLDYSGLLKLSPYEFTWYNAWFQKVGLIKEIAVEPFFKMFHLRQEYTYSRLKLLRNKDYAYSYVGLILNSKWTTKTPLNYVDPESYFYRIFYCLWSGESRLSKIYMRFIRKDIFTRLLSKGSEKINLMLKRF